MKSGEGGRAAPRDAKLPTDAELNDDRSEVFRQQGSGDELRNPPPPGGLEARKQAFEKGYGAFKKTPFPTGELPELGFGTAHPPSPKLRRAEQVRGLMLRQSVTNRMNRGQSTNLDSLKPLSGLVGK